MNWKVASASGWLVKPDDAMPKLGGLVDHHCPDNDAAMWLHATALAIYSAGQADNKFVN